MLQPHFWVTKSVYLYNFTPKVWLQLGLFRILQALMKPASAELIQLIQSSTIDARRGCQQRSKHTKGSRCGDRWPFFTLMRNRTAPVCVYIYIYIYLFICCIIYICSVCVYIFICCIIYICSYYRFQTFSREKVRV